jgi:hypothetical protein
MLTMLLLAVMITATAQAPAISINGGTVPLSLCPVVIPVNATEMEKKAASEMQHYLGLVTGVKPEVTDEQAKMKQVEIVIGRSNRFPLTVELNTLDPDGFVIITEGSRLCIAGGTHKGTLYGVYEFLERHLGCHFLTPDAELIPVLDSVVVPALDIRENPAFGSRETYYAGMEDPVFADKMRCDRHAWKGAEDWGLWVHTMFTLVPPEKYFETHPEYYALMAGKRAKTQLCLTNPEVLSITIESLRERMKEKPEATYWSVSQMDTYGACECASCKVIDDYEGGASGSMITFVNKVAEAFPDKVISTLAYQYTRSAPKHIRPASNVNIMLCTIECDRSKPIAQDTSAGSFVKDLRDWSRISDDILVWDYVIQFTNMLAPFPNLPVLQPNLQLFDQYGVKSVFEQGAHKTYTENQELRRYLLARLLWNPRLDFDSLSDGFLHDYYGPAAPMIRRYHQRMEQALAASGQTLWIYAGPMQETGSFLGPDEMAAYNRYFNVAEKAVAGDTALMSRLARARLPLRYAMLEVARKNITGPDGFLEERDGKMVVRKDLEVQLDEFVTLANRYGVKNLHEAGLTPDQYREKVQARFRNAWSDHLAKGKPYTLAVEPAAKYRAEGPGTLTDGKRGSENFHVLWQGFEGADLEAVIDLGQVTEFNYVGAEFIQDLTSWIFYPTGMTVAVSDDGKVFRTVAGFDALSYPDRLIVAEAGKTIPATRARYVKFTARNIKQCPAWHIGHGGTAWLFADELIVDKR